MSVVCAPERAPGSSSGSVGGGGSLRQRRASLLGLLSAAPPFTRPGQPLALTNHAVGGAEFALQPAPSGAARLPGWALPAAIVLSASDAASGGDLVFLFGCNACIVARGGSPAGIKLAVCHDLSLMYIPTYICAEIREPNPQASLTLHCRCSLGELSQARWWPACWGIVCCCQS